MWKGFTLKIPFPDDYLTKVYERVGRVMSDNDRDSVRNNIDSFIDDYGALDGKRLMDDWFPSVEADVFISHSHSDEDRALALAGWLSMEFNLNVFVDSAVWKCADDLLWCIDDRHCRLKGERLFSYESRNRSTSHVHMMLATALGKMIDRTECLMFLNTSNSMSISPSGVVDGVDGTTQSPWIFGELSTAGLCQRKQPVRPLLLANERLRAKAAAPRVNYPLSFGFLTEIRVATLKKWAESHSRNIHPLDTLYIITGQMD